MIAVDMYVGPSLLAGDVVNGQPIDSVREGASELESAAATVLGSSVDHMCQEVETVSGAKCVVSNNALVVVEHPSQLFATRNVQRIANARVAVLIDGVLSFEPALARPLFVAPVAQLMVPDGTVVAGRDASKRILFTLPR